MKRIVISWFSVSYNFRLFYHLRLNYRQERMVAATTPPSYKNKTKTRKQKCCSHSECFFSHHDKRIRITIAKTRASGQRCVLMNFVAYPLIWVRLESCFDFIHALYAFLIISVHKILNFGHFPQKHYRHTDGPTDRRTDRRTDTPSYRDARTHLKIHRLVDQYQQIK